MSLVSKYVDLFPSFYATNHRFTQMFEAFVASLGIKKKAIIYSVFGNQADSLPRNDDKDHVHILWSGEPFVRDNLDKYDLLWTMQETSTETKTACFPLLLLEALSFNKEYFDQLTRPRTLIARAPYFCCQVTSNNNHDSHVRNNFFIHLQQWLKENDASKSICSLGRNYNNVGFLAPENDDTGKGAYFNLLLNFRFMLCFENSQQPYYLSEKIMNAWLAGTIPVYWGCSSVDKWLNPKAFLQLKNTSGGPFPSEADMNTLMNEILRLDDDPIAFKEIYEQPLITTVPDDLNYDVIMQKSRDILLHHRPDAF